MSDYEICVKSLLGGLFIRAHSHLYVLEFSQCSCNPVTEPYLSPRNPILSLAYLHVFTGICTSLGYAL